MTITINTTKLSNTAKMTGRLLKAVGRVTVRSAKGVVKAVKDEVRLNPSS
mgnify:CR=1 FL=1